MLETAKEFIPYHKIKISPSDKPWITKKVKASIKKRNRLYKQYKRTRRPEHYLLYKEVSRDVNISISSAKEDHKQKLINQLENPSTTPRQYWNIYKQMTGSKIDTTIPTLVENDRQCTSAIEKATLLAEYFASQSQTPQNTNNTAIDQLLIPDSNILTTITVTENEVLTVLRKLNIHKAMGPDGLPNHLLKLIADQITPSLTILFNLCLDNGTFPDQWKKANITPVYKKGQKELKSNYRPISLLPAISKVLERIIFNRIYAHLESNGHLTWRNSGYKKADSTINQLLYITHQIQQNLDDGDDTGLVFLDQSRAFDRIWHEGLLAKIKSCGINGPLLTFLQSYLSNRKIRVVIEGCESDWNNISAGVPQGSILGPLLFLIYINDITTSLESQIHLYADDAVLMLNLHRDPTSIDIINRDLERLNEWADIWHMQFNASKTKYMIVSRTKFTNYAIPCLNNAQLEKVSTYPQLGIHFDETMSWEAHINQLILKVNRKIGLIWKVSEHLPRSCAENIYTMYIRPIIDYGCVIYDNCSKHLQDKLEDTQRRAAVACTRAFSRTPTSALLTELGWPTLSTRRDYFRILQLYKMKNHLTPDYLRTILPPPHGHYSGYPTRYSNNYIVPLSTTTKHHESFIPKSTRGWNSLDEQLKSCNILHSFKTLQKKKLFPTKFQHLSNGKGKHSINHTRMRLGLSHLRQQLYSFRIIDSFYCTHCTDRLETTTYYLLTCPKYTDICDEMLRLVGEIGARHGINLDDLIKLKSILLKGDSNMTLAENNLLFDAVQKYIGKSKRF